MLQFLKVMAHSKWSFDDEKVTAPAARAPAPAAYAWGAAAEPVAPAAPPSDYLVLYAPVKGYDVNTGIQTDRTREQVDYILRGLAWNTVHTRHSRSGTQPGVHRFATRRPNTVRAWVKQHTGLDVRVQLPEGTVRFEVMTPRLIGWGYDIGQSFLQQLRKKAKHLRNAVEELKEVSMFCQYEYVPHLKGSLGGVDKLYMGNHSFKVEPEHYKTVLRLLSQQLPPGIQYWKRDYEVDFALDG
jgi:hypothetical protein